MGKRVDSSALVGLNRGLGLAGPAAGETELEDERLIQVIDVASVARQGLAPGTGIFYFGMSCTTSVANPSLNVVVDPYRADDPSGVSTAVAPFPIPVPREFDIFLISASMSMASTTFVDALLRLTTIPVGFSIHNDDATVAPGGLGINHNLAAWDGQVVVNNSEIGILGDAHVNQSIRQRIGRGSIMELRVDAGGIGFTEVVILACLMPAAMGQDVGI